MAPLHSFQDQMIMLLFGVIFYAILFGIIALAGWGIFSLVRFIFS